MRETAPSAPPESSSGDNTGPEMALGLMAMVAAALAMSVSPTLVRFADVGPMASAFWRVLLALPVLWLWMKQDERPLRGTVVKRFALPTILAGFAFAGDLLFWHLAIVNTTIANATFFATMAPIWVVVFGFLLLRQRTEPIVLGGMALCILGGSALVYESLGLNPEHAIGDAQGVITGMFFGLYFLCVGAARKISSAGRVTFELSIVTALVLFAFAIFLDDNLIPKSASGWAVLFALALVSHVGGQGLLSVALGRLPTTFSSLVIFIEAVAAAGFAWVFVDEPVSLVQAMGAGVIVAGIWIARPRHKRPVILIE
ncbi:DMT family transporter [Rhizobium sp. L1K21]|uniref:DMT family transporter n=1 Tax=Rhizobium sp. L1K21 TaxID=2954933 RepID=UPI00209211E2|nr:DMT family transporter [Rhizobium sp. L1K21]MCO6186916.1 DMT family transporter [Rhizobium sp. L1K21]